MDHKKNLKIEFYPLVNIQKAIEHGPVERVENFPLE